MPVENINSRCSGYTVSSGNICECCIWRFEISENIEYSSYRELSSKGEGIIFIECLLAVGTLVLVLRQEKVPVKLKFLY